MNCDQCGRYEDEAKVCPWDLMMGKLCTPCYTEVMEHPPQKIVRALMPEEERNEIRRKALEKAREVRSAKAADKKTQREETRARRRAQNPEAYDAAMAKRIEALKLAREAQKTTAPEKELTAASV